MHYSKKTDSDELVYPREWLADEETRLAAKQSRLQAIADYSAFSNNKKRACISNE